MIITPNVDCARLPQKSLFVVPFTFRFWYVSLCIHIFSSLWGTPYEEGENVLSLLKENPTMENEREWDKQLRSREYFGCIKFVHISWRFFLSRKLLHTHFHTYMNVIEILINPKVMLWFCLLLSFLHC